MMRSSPHIVPAPVAAPDGSVGCRDECGNRANEPESSGWQFLEISKQWRCPSCMRVLALVNQTAEL